MSALLERSRVADRLLVAPETVGPLIRETAAEELPTRRDLLLQALLHLPRIAGADGAVSLRAARSEIERQRELRASELAPLASLAKVPSSPPSLSELAIEVVEPDLAETVLGNFHYLRSYRSDSVSVGAFHRDRLVALCAVAPLDIPELASQLTITSLDEAAVVTRVFAFDWAPRNVISYLLARIGRSSGLANDRLLVTYLNPNLGFTGASLKAANWQQIGTEVGTRYAYLDGRYITDRRLAELESAGIARVEYSRMWLRPLLVYGRDGRHSRDTNPSPFIARRPRH